MYVYIKQCEIHLNVCHMFAYFKKTQECVIWDNEKIDRYNENNYNGGNFKVFVNQCDLFTYAFQGSFSGSRGNLLMQLKWPWKVWVQLHNMEP